MSGDFSSDFGTANGLSHYQYQTQWMSHWMQGNTNLFLQSDARNKDNYSKGGLFQVENTQDRKGKLVSISSTHGNNLQDRNIFRSDTEFGLALCLDQSAESLDRCKEGSLELQKNLKMEDAGVGLPDSLSLHKLADCSPSSTIHEACCCLQDDHFPMYDINRRMGSILNQQKRSAHSQVAGRLSETQMTHDETTFLSNVIELASEENHQLEAQRLTGKAPKTEISKSAQTLPICKDEPTILSQPAGGSFSCLGPNFMLSNFTELRMGSSSIHHVHSKHSINKFKNESCNLSGSSRFCHSEMKYNNEMISSRIRSSKAQKNVRYMSFKRDLWSDDLHFSSLDNQNAKYQVNRTGNRTKANSNSFAHSQSSNDMGLSHQKLCKKLNCSVIDAEIHATSNSTDNVNGGSQNISNSFRHWLIAKNMGTNFCHREQLNVNATQSAKDKTTALYEMLAIPAILKKQLEDSQHLVSSSRGSHDADGSWNDAHIMISGKALATKTTTNPIDTCQKEVSLEPVVSAKPSKDPERPWLIKFQSITPLLVKQEICRDIKTEMINGHMLFPISENAVSINHREPSVSRTESMNLDLVLSHVQNPHAPISRSVLESSLQIEPCSKWLKRLRQNPSDTQSIGSKRFKLGDGPTKGEACNFINYNASNSAQQLSNVRKSSLGDAKCLPGVSTKELNCWVKRWCHKSPQMPQSGTAMAASALYEQENRKLSPESSEGRLFPSIAAMALMGKVMKRLRTCEFQKKGFSVIWNAESL